MQQLSIRQRKVARRQKSDLVFLTGDGSWVIEILRGDNERVEVGWARNMGVFCHHKEKRRAKQIEKKRDTAHISGN